MFYNVQTEQSYRWRVISNESDGIELFSNTNGRWVIAIIKKKILRQIIFYKRMDLLNRIY